MDVKKLYSLLTDLFFNPGKITPTRPGTPIPGENSFHLVFEVTDRTKYALDANTSNDTVSVKVS